MILKKFIFSSDDYLNQMPKDLVDELPLIKHKTVNPMKLKTLNFCLVMAGLTACSHGALSFTEDFSDNSASPNMTLGVPNGSPTTSMVGAFTITSGPLSRVCLGTNDKDFSLYDFSFETDVTVPNDNNPWAIVFIGMGSSDISTTIPNQGSHIYTLSRNDNSNLESSDNGTFLTNKTGVPVINGTHGIRMEWNATTKLATFLFDVGNDGTYDPALTFTVNGADNGFNATNSQLFLGGGDGLVFDNIVVTVPEPSAALLGGLGVLGLLCRRRN